MARCPYCSGEFTYAFRASKVLPGLAVVSVAMWFLVPYTGPIIIPAGFAIPFLMGMYLDKWY